ncbi:MAG: hypothetical protein KGJ13_12220 [Patescibacteria group bacterium]|nr:hypothetical protein [Patescibacteria group bacterium]
MIDKEARMVTTTLVLVVIILAAGLVNLSHKTFVSKLDTEMTIASLKNRWCQLNDELQSLKKDNERLRRDVKRIKSGKRAESEGAE